MATAQKQPRSPISPSFGQIHTDIGALSQRVLSNENALTEFKAIVQQELSGIGTQLANLSNAIANANKTPWSNIFAGLSAIAALIVFFVFQPLNNSLDKLERAHNAATNSFVGLREHELYVRFTEEKLKDLKDELRLLKGKN